MIHEAIEKISKKVNLTEAEMRGVFSEIMSGNAVHADIVKFLVALRDKGETVEEITAAARVMRDKALNFKPYFEDRNDKKFASLFALRL